MVKGVPYIYMVLLPKVLRILEEINLLIFLFTYITHTLKCSDLGFLRVEKGHPPVADLHNEFIGQCLFSNKFLSNTFLYRFFRII